MLMALHEHTEIQRKWLKFENSLENMETYSKIHTSIQSSSI